MKYQTPALLVAIAAGSSVAAAPSPNKVNIPLAESVMNSAAFEVFNNKDVPVLTVKKASKRAGGDPEPDPNRPAVTPDYVFVLQCLEAGFRGDCLVFGAPPGQCVSYFDFDSGNDTSVSDKYNNAITSLSTNTGGTCQFYWYKGCDNKGDDRGLSSAYNYNLNVSLPSDPRTVEYVSRITSWKC